MANRENSTSESPSYQLETSLNDTIELLSDPVSADQQAQYRMNGLTYVSNNESIVPRDLAGNIILNEGATNNPLLIIDAVTEQITTKSALKLLDTRFQYYKFPATIRETNAIEDLIVDINFDTDIIYARYKPSENRKIAGGSVNPTFSGILMNEVEEGLPQKNTNGYYITKAIKNSGADLRFRININHRYDSSTITPRKVAFTIIKQGPNYPLNRTYLGQYSRSGYDGRWSYITPYEVWNTFIDVTISNSEVEIGDYFSIGALSEINDLDNYHTINSEQTYWVITDASKNVDGWNQPI
jgi:hypothetical protein